MKKIILSFITLFFIPAFAVDRLRVEALEDFNSLNPKETFKVKLLEDNVVYETPVYKDSILNCSLNKVTNPKRAKMDAKIYFNIISYEDNNGFHEISTPLKGKYAQKVINKEGLKESSPQIAKKAVGTIGNFFLQGFSYGLSFANGIRKNEEGNRLKSGVKEVYDDSFLSFVEYGEEINIATGDIFYLIVKEDKD